MIPEAAVEEVATRLFDTHEHAWTWEKSSETYRDEARHLLEAAAPHMLRAISTTAELDALPAGSVIMGFDVDGDQLVSRKSEHEGLWEQAGTDDGWQAPDIIKWHGSVQVLHAP